ncbi:hypothetical protein ACH5RR_018665 [Cinchona calisaya]|uniref:Rad60/SUMO-like domain-containing protein n=1 Tax=Cinchona calisaya TaxID=153742 RepID=A0ABD2ZM78_9GENT
MEGMQGLKRNVLLGRLMLVYCHHLGLESAALRFNFDGSRVQEWHTTDGIGLVDGDAIDVWDSGLICPLVVVVSSHLALHCVHV